MQRGILRELLARCLAKDVRERWRDIGDVRYELDRVAERQAPAAHARAGKKLAVAVLAAFVLGGLSSTLFRRGPAEDLAPPAVKRFVAATGYIADGLAGARGFTLWNEPGMEKLFERAGSGRARQTRVVRCGRTRRGRFVVESSPP